MMTKTHKKIIGLENEEFCETSISETRKEVLAKDQLLKIKAQLEDKLNDINERLKVFS